MDKSVSAGIAVMLFGFLGIVAAFIEQTLYNEGMMLDEFTTGTVTIADIMGVTILLFCLFGIVIALVKS